MGRGDEAANIRTSPESMTYYYMDTFLCNNYFLQNEECMKQYYSMSAIRVKARRVQHKECLNYLDQYKACLIGINQQAVGAQDRKVLTEQQLIEKR